MRFSAFILENLDQIVEEWVGFARQLSPTTAKMSAQALANHSRKILTAIAKDMEIAQDEAARRTKGKGHAARPGDAHEETAATAHGGVRLLDGMDLDEMVSEYRALRACVLQLWRDAPDPGADRGQAVEEIARFNEGIDQALAESVKKYTGQVAQSRDLFLGVLGHDLRSPLSTMFSSTAILDTPNAPPASSKGRSTESGVRRNE